MNGVIEDEKKPFDVEAAQNDEDSHPDPDEELMLDQGQGKVWLVKVRVQPRRCQWLPQEVLDFQ